MALSDSPVRAQIPVSDIHRAVDFYGGKLGLPVLKSGPSAEIADGGRIYGSGGGPGLVVHQTTARGSQATVATWYADDIKHVVDDLAANGVEIVRHDELEHDDDGITVRAGGGRIGWFENPDSDTFAIESDA